MKRVLQFLLPVILLVAAVAYARSIPIGVLTSTGASVNNTTTAVPFAVAQGGKFSFQCTAPVCILGCTNGSSCSVSCTFGQSNTGEQTTTMALFDLPGDGAMNSISMVPVSGAASCQVFQLTQ